MGHEFCHDRSQVFIRAHNEALTVATVRLSNEDCSSDGNNR
jgi:hypothetical protein